MQGESVYDIPRPTPRPVPTIDDIREILNDLVAYEQQRIQINKPTVRDSTMQALTRR